MRLQPLRVAFRRKQQPSGPEGRHYIGSDRLGWSRALPKSSM